MSVLNKDGQTEEEFLAFYDPSEFERPSVSVDVLVFAIETIPNEDVRKLADKKLQVLLIKRANHPYINTWGVPGGFVQMNENLEEAALRELKEETSVDNIYIEQLYTWGDVDRDPRTRVISTSYMALINKIESKLQAGTDAIDVKWFDVEEKILEEENIEEENFNTNTKVIQLILKSDEIKLKTKLKETIKVVNKFTTSKIEILDGGNISFDHAKIIYHGLLRMRNKIEYTDIAFSLLPNEFTLAELQQVFEVILNKSFTKPNFQRKIKPMVVETNKFEGGGHRPARLYRFNKEWKEKSS